MKNHRLLKAPKKDLEKFVETAKKFIQKYAKDKKVLCALSGGIDSSATYLLLKEADADVLPVFIDHGLMRVIEGKDESEHIKELFPEVKIVNIRRSFLRKIYYVGDAEKKRKLFKDAYSEAFNEIIEEEKCDYLADGTILPDLEESFGVTIKELKETMTPEEETALREAQKGEGFVKSQHNVEIEYDVEGTIQPIASLTKNRVRELLKHLDMPDKLVYRKAFPGPALAARIVGPVTPDNRTFEQRVHDITESAVNKYYIEKHGQPMIFKKNGEQEPFQVFAATFKSVESSRVTGMRDGKRTYLTPMVYEGKWDFDRLVKEGSELDENFSRYFYVIKKREGGEYDVVIRCVNSVDARTATVTKLPLELLKSISDDIFRSSKVHLVAYDCTPKPPGTIEYV